MIGSRKIPWGLRISGDHKILIWKILNDVLPVGSELGIRNMMNVRGCAFCSVSGGN